jgi:hypothetical protein
MYTNVFWLIANPTSAQFFHTIHKTTQEDVERRIKVLAQGFELLQFSKFLGNVTACLRHYRLCLEDLPMLDEFQYDLQLKLDSLSLSRVQGWLDRLYVNTPPSMLALGHSLIIRLSSQGSLLPISATLHEYTRRSRWLTSCVGSRTSADRRIC